MKLLKNMKFTLASALLLVSPALFAASPNAISIDRLLEILRPQQYLSPVEMVFKEAPTERLETGTCSRPNTKVSYIHEEDYKDACMALTLTEDFFHTFGHHVGASVNIVFKDKVTSEIIPGRQVRVFGRYDRAENIVYMTSLKSDFIRDPDRRDFGLSLTTREDYLQELQLSRLVHFVTNFYVQDNLDKNGVMNLKFAWRKFVNYTVQLTTMRNTELLGKILKSYPDAKFKSLEDVNLIMHNDSPQKFGVMSYKLFDSNQGGEDLLAQILYGKVEQD